VIISPALHWRAFCLFLPVTADKKQTSIIFGTMAKENIKGIGNLGSQAGNALFDKELLTKRLIEVLSRESQPESALRRVCAFISESAFQKETIHVRIQFGGRVFLSPAFKEEGLVVSQVLDLPDQSVCNLEIFIRENSSGHPTGEPAGHILDICVPMLTGILSKIRLKKVYYDIGERKKELSSINQTTRILQTSRNFEDALQSICNILPDGWQYPDFTAARIRYNRKEYVSRDFKDTPWVMAETFELPKKKKGTIEIFYLQEFGAEDEGPFLTEERNLLINIANLISGSATRKVFNKLIHDSTERLKELKAINNTSRIIEEGMPVEETLQEICCILPRSWQYPRHTAARIRFEGNTYMSKEFDETPWMQSEPFVTIDNKVGTVEVFYQRQFPDEDEGPFLREERNLLINISKLISGYLNNFKGRGIIQLKGISPHEIHPSDAFRTTLTRNKKPLQLYFNQQAIDKYIYLDMMKYKIKHILFVSTFYDAFTLESEDSFFAKFMGEIYQYGLFSVPRITGASNPEEALELLETTHFDLVILMAGMDRDAPLHLSEQIRERNESMPIYLLLNRKSEIKYYEDLLPSLRSVDKLFVWSGDSLILFAIVKLTEDKVNVENDTRIGLVRVILIIEDSSIYYSKYIQILYDIVFNHVRGLLPEVEQNELDKISRMRSRPKILHARNYEEATAIFNKYRDFMLCVISDMEFERNGRLEKFAGVRFIRYVKSHISKLPIILQSSESDNELIAKQLDVTFINKNSDSLLKDIKHFLNSYLGFGNFVFRDRKGNKIGVAKSLREFETLLQEVPDESLYLHASENQLSLWLMQRGEIQLARELNPMSISMFSSMEETRQHLLDTIKRYREEKKKGKILSFDETSIIDEKNIVSFAGGSLGGKGRGLAFINTLIYNLEFPELTSRINILTPITVIIGTDEFQQFIAKNKLFDKIIDPEISYPKLREHFVRGQLSAGLLKRLKVFIGQIDKPIAVRSSSIAEDSINQPFAGIFDTFIVPNGINKKHVFEQICTAIKLVFASTFSPKARNYFTIIHHKIEEEKMAVILQELVGNQYGEYYYPHISGVAQSFNYYPVANMKPEEGFAVAAFGLGTYVVDGWKSYRFSPTYPTVSMYTTKDLVNGTQVQFYALDCLNTDIDFLKDGELAALKLLDIYEADSHGTLKHCVSVYDPDNDRLDPGDKGYGPLVVNFANILKYNYIPLAETINTILETVQESFGSPVEIEYAVDLERTRNGLPTFYLLQIKPLITDQIGKNIKVENLNKQNMLLYTKSCVGNGEVSTIRDVIYIDIEKFTKLKTVEMADEIDQLNRKMISENKQYLLIGPGRWGSRDRFVGIPVNWSQISNAKVIVEISLHNFPLDSSLGSHFFHNVTAMNIGYFSVQHSSATDFIRWEILDQQQLVQQTEFYRHICFDKPLTIYMDGRHKTSAVMLPAKTEENN
jgi:CheY-like chemotaxis protein